MGKGMRKDLQARLEAAHEKRTCLVAESASDARRLREAMRRGDVVSPAPRVFALANLWMQLKPPEQERRRCRALSCLHPDWVFAGASAAALHGLWVSYSMLGKVHLACRRQSHTRNSRHIARHVIAGCDATTADGVPVTPLTRTAFDCARTFPYPDAMAIVDSTLRLSDMSWQTLVDAFVAMGSRWSGAWRAVETAALADARAENGGESVARAIMLRHGYMLPELQREIPDPMDGTKVYRADFYWELPNGDVIGELDGREKYANPQMTDGRDMVDILADERLRESRCSFANARVMRFSYADVMDPQRFCRLLSVFGIPGGFAPPRVAVVASVGRPPR